MYSMGLSRIAHLMLGRGGGAGGISLSDTIQGTEPSNLRWYFPCNESEANKPATDTVSSKTISTEGGGDSLVNYGQPGQVGTSIQVGEFGSLDGDGTADDTLFNIFDKTGGFTFGILVNPDIVGDVDGVCQFNDTNTSTRFIIRMEALGKVFIGLLLGGNNQNISDVGIADHFEVGTWAWTFVRVDASGVIDLFHNGDKTAAVGTNNSGTGTDTDLTGVTIGRSSTNRAAMSFQHICGWDTPLTDEQIMSIVSASGV